MWPSWSAGSRFASLDRGGAPCNGCRCTRGRSAPVRGGSPACDPLLIPGSTPCIPSLRRPARSGVRGGYAPLSTPSVRGCVRTCARSAPAQLPPIDRPSGVDRSYAHPLGDVSVSPSISWWATGDPFALRDHLLHHRPGGTRRADGGRPSGRAPDRPGRRAGLRRQRVPGPGGPGAARDAGGLRRHRPRARRVPVRRRHLPRHAADPPDGPGDRGRWSRRNRGAAPGPGQGRPARHPGSADGGPGDRGAGGQGPDRDQGRAADHPPRPARAVPGVHAHRRARRDLPAHRAGEGAQPPAGVRRAQPQPGHGLHRAHRVRGRPHRRPEGRHGPSSSAAGSKIQEACKGQKRPEPAAR